jgi:hypothetical protein
MRKGGTDSRSCQDLLSVISEDQVSEDVTLFLGNTNPATRLLRTLRGKFVIHSIVDLLPPVELQEGGDVGLLVEGNFKRSLPVQGVQRKMVQQTDGEQSAQQPVDSRSASAVHNAISHAFDLPNLLLSIVLILLMGFRLTILHTVQA